jgi:hypothetical protein
VAKYLRAKSVQMLAKFNNRPAAVLQMLTAHIQMLVATGVDL